MLAGLTISRDTDHVVAKLLRIGLGHSAHPSSGTSRRHRSDVTYPCGSPVNKQIHAGRIPAQRAGREWAIPLSALTGQETASGAASGR